MFAKNAQINSLQRIDILLAELSDVSLDIILFSETRAASATVILDGGHKLYSVHGNDFEKVSSVGILVEKQLVHSVIDVHRCSDRVMAVDMRSRHHCIRIISIYAPLYGYGILPSASL